MNKKIIVVTGGAGYIGSCTAALIKQKGYEPIIFDNFSTSRRPSHFMDSTFEVDLTQFKEVESLFNKLPPVHAIFHFAAKALVPESTEKIWDYFQNNINATLNMAECATQFAIPHFIHSSTCAVYGNSESLPISESAPLRPETPYGQSKLISENILEQFARWKGLKVLNLRYFNPAGGIPELGLGELHQPETHLIPNLVKHFSQNSLFEVYGNDYPTKDGTCIRDFIHIRDLAMAHLLGLNFLEAQSKPTFETLNIGTGQGISVAQAIEATKKVLGTEGNVEFRSRRPGDPPHLVADTAKMKHILQWTPEFNIDRMIGDHWKFIRAQVN